MSPAHYTELINAFSRQDMVVVCWHPECHCHRLRGWSEGEWATYPRQRGYTNYSHGICEDHFADYLAEAQTASAGRPLNSTATDSQRNVAPVADRP